MKTRRELIIQLLTKNETPLSTEEIASVVFSDIKNVLEDLSHIAKTLKNKEKSQLLMIPPKCKLCGFIFSRLKQPKMPSKCPKCKSQRILSPRFTIRK